MKQSLGLVSLVVRDYDEALAFYVGMLGLTLLEDTDLGAGKRWVRVGIRGGMAILLARAASDIQLSRVGSQTGGRVFVFLHTDDCHRDSERFRAAGVKFRDAPRTETYGVVAVLEDPYGNLIDLIEPLHGHSSSPA